MERKEFLRISGFAALSMGVTPYIYSCKDSSECDEEICRAAWEKLCGRLANHPNGSFNYVHPQKRIPNVLLYGDSISIAYTPIVRENLKGKATVFRLYRNGASSHGFIPFMDQMQETMFQPNLNGGWNFKWDLIHFNVGLHDLKYLDGNNLSKEKGKQVSSVEEYKENLKEICGYLKEKFPKAKLVFATTTPVPANAKGRYQGDSIKFNNAAVEILANYPDIAINDLYAFSFPHLKSWAIQPGDVHYNETGYTQQGIEVARIIAENL